MKHNRSKGSSSSKKSLIVQKLENISKSIFRNYYKQITELIGNSHGIYKTEIKGTGVFLQLIN